MEDRDDQVSTFLSCFKSNLQANVSLENALIEAIDVTTPPLYDELVITKSLIETGSFASAVAFTKQQTNSVELKFLLNSIELALEVGANLEEQIENIENIISERNRLKRLKRIAIAHNKPLIYVSAALIPLVFIFAYIVNEQAREFWFNSLLSWVLLGIVVVVTIISFFVSKRIIAKAVD
jgi:Flp pilus assembly protein TadB